MRNAITKENVSVSLERSLQESKDEKVLYGNPRELIKKF